MMKAFSGSMSSRDTTCDTYHGPQGRSKTATAARRILGSLLREPDRSFPAVALAEAGDIDGAVELLQAESTLPR